MFIFISFQRLSGQVCFEIRNIWRKRKKMRGEEWWQFGAGGGRWVQTHVTSDTGPQCPSVNSMCVLLPHVCLCVQCRLYSPAPGVLWVVAPVCDSAVTSLHEPLPRLSHTQKHTQRDTHTAPGLPYPLKARKHRCGSRLMLYGLGARIQAHTL